MKATNNILSILFCTSAIVILCSYKPLDNIESYTKPKNAVAYNGLTANYTIYSFGRKEIFYPEASYYGDEDYRFYIFMDIWTHVYTMDAGKKLKIEQVAEIISDAVENEQHPQIFARSYRIVNGKKMYHFKYRESGNLIFCYMAVSGKKIVTATAVIKNQDTYYDQEIKDIYDFLNGLVIK